MAAVAATCPSCPDQGPQGSADPRRGTGQAGGQACPSLARGLPVAWSRPPPGVEGASAHPLGPRGRRTRLSEGSGHRYSQGPHPEPSSEPLPVPLLPPPQAGSRDHRPLRAGRATRSPGQAASQRFQAQSLGRPSSQEPCNKTPSSSHLRSPWRCVHLQCPGGGGGGQSQFDSEESNMLGGGHCPGRRRCAPGSSWSRRQGRTRAARLPQGPRAPDSTALSSHPSGSHCCRLTLRRGTWSEPTAGWPFLQDICPGPSLSWSMSGRPGLHRAGLASVWRVEGPFGGPGCWCVLPEDVAAPRSSRGSRAGGRGPAGSAGPLVRSLCSSARGSP